MIIYSLSLVKMGFECAGWFAMLSGNLLETCRGSRMQNLVLIHVSSVDTFFKRLCTACYHVCNNLVHTNGVNFDILFYMSVISVKYCLMITW